ncbi:MAG: hypothetical protein IJO52_12265 [Clostridia bacterium]|nr:hypothetical protein [Clostridia bacterium]
MDIDKKDIDALVSMSDNDFCKKFSSALESAGASDDVMKRFCQNVPQLKKTLSSLSPDDVETLVRRIDPEALEKIRKSLEE